MGIFKRNINPRRKQLKENLAAERFAKLSEFINSGIPWSILILIGFIAVCSFLLSIVVGQDKLGFYLWYQTVSVVFITAGIGIAMAVYVYHYNRKIVKNPLRAVVLCSLFILLLALTKSGFFFQNHIYLAVASSIICAIVLTIVYDQRFAIGMSLFFASLVCFAAGRQTDFALFLAMAAGILTSCFLLKEIRTRIKLLEVGVFAGAAVFIVSFAAGLFEKGFSGSLFVFSGRIAAVTIFVGIIIQAFLPLIEKIFHVATSMTLLDYSDANQPLLKKLAMEAPGTFSHSLLIGSIAQTAAETIGANGLLCRVGAYYHDIGKIGKPYYFIENQMGTASRHEQLSPAMSQLIIAGHVKDGIEMAKEYRLPAVIMQFIETHHGTTLIEYFYEEARKKTNGNVAPPSEVEFRYPGPRPQMKEAAIVMLADTVEGAVRALTEITPTKIETVVHNMAVKRLQDGQFDDCDLTLRELSRIEDSLSKSLAAHYHGRIAYPKPAEEEQTSENGKENV
ncbi:MAG: HDIG domain-containing protein [Phycisphaerae bacterium]|nr:HDIG domain-containing protein [Phycisphaerae bacterium]